jgi:L-threonylcarbamoyladenylate synthase
MHAAAKSHIQRAVAVLRAGGLVAFPTETVYGLGADASNAEAVQKIFAAKGRPPNHPVIVHLPDASHFSQWASEIPEAAHVLAQRFWPGPLTLVLKRAPRVSDLITGGQNTVGLRVPGHALALELLREFGSAIAAPSANRFGRLSATTADHVREELGDKVDFVLDGGPCDVGIESTIVDLSQREPTLLRPGKISRSEIESAVGRELAVSTSTGTRAPGTLPSHYSPRTPLEIVDAGQLGNAAAKNVAVLSFGEAMSRRWISAPRGAAEYARALYANLRTLDEMQCEAILVERVPESEEWAAIRDRLDRAAH